MKIGCLWIGVFIASLAVWGCGDTRTLKECGNNKIDEGETCDPPESCPESCDDSDPCTKDAMSGSAEECNVECSNTLITGCVDFDGCCPEGCNANNDNNCPPVCGNDVIEEGETCDPPASCPTACDDGNPCTEGTLAGSAADCTAECGYAVITDCVDGDGCCPAGCNANDDSDCSVTCGNDVIEPGETCDPPASCPATCDDGNHCTVDTMTGSAQNCNVACSRTIITDCIDSDGCCPAGCDNNTDNDCSVTCGNDVIEPGETCDPPASCPATCDDGNHCTVDTMTGSAANCNVACSRTVIVDCVDDDGCCPAGCNANLDNDCSPTCGNDVIEPGETCDPPATCPADCDDGNPCTIDTMTGSAANCNATCSRTAIVDCVDGDGCCPAGCNANTDNDCSSTCGNDAIEPGETCDPPATCPADCDDLDPCTIDTMTGSADNCNVACSYTNIINCVDDDGCCPAGCNANTDNDCSPVCGNNVVEAGETCDPPASCPATCDDIDPCTVDSMTGGADTCDVACSYTDIVACIDGDGCCPAGCSSLTDNDCPPPTFPRILVGDHDGAKIWDNADTIIADRAADAHLGGLLTRGRGLALYQDRLFVATDHMEHPIYIYDNASLLADGSPNDDTIDVAAFGGTSLFEVYEMSVDSSANLWIDYGSIRLFADADTLGSASGSQAQFTHVWGPQIHSMALDVAGNKLLGGQVSGDGVIAWDDPTSKTGETNDNDWRLKDFIAPSSMAIHGGRLYVGGWIDPYINIWDNISSLTAGADPDATMGAASNLSDVRHVFLRNDILVVTVSHFPGPYKVNIYKNAGSITGDVLPDFEITDASMSMPEKSYLDANDNLYVMDNGGILIFSNATTAPTFKTKLEMDVSGPYDFLLMECSLGFPCAFGEDCLEGMCVPRPWASVGDNPIDGLGSDGVLSHDLGTDGSWPTVAFVHDQGATRQVDVATYTGDPAWSPLDPPPWTGAVDPVALEFDGATPYVMYSKGGFVDNVQVKYHDGGAWQEVGSPGYTSACVGHFSIALAMEGATPHLVTYGAGGCGIGVDYSWWGGAAWQQHPSATMPGQLTMNGGGKPDIVFTDHAYVALNDSGIHSVKYWDSIGEAWSDLGSPLSMNADTGWPEDISITADEFGNLYVAWAENDGSGIVEIYVKEYGADWSLVGTGRVSGPGSARSPSIAVIGSTPWVTYVEDVGGVDRVFVRRWNTTAWQQVGQALNNNFSSPAYDPVIVGVGGVPHVAFREEYGGAQSLYVKSFP